MNRLLFVLKNAWLGIKAKKLLSTVVIAAVTVGLVFPVIVLTQINYINEYYRVSFYKDIEHTGIVDVHAPLMSEDEAEKFFMSLGSNIKSAGFQATYQTTYSYNDKKEIMMVAGYNNEYTEVGKTVLLHGRFITPKEHASGAKVCMISERMKSCKLGDTIRICGEDFEIVGIYRDIKIYGQAVVPYNAMYKWFEKAPDRTLQYKAYLLSDGDLNRTEINLSVKKEEIKNRNFHKLEVTTAVDAEADVAERVADIYEEKLLVGAVVTLFSIISFTLIIVGRILSEQYVVGVKTAMGATKGQLFLDLAVQNFILIQFAAILAMLGALCISEAMPSAVDVIFDGKIVLAVEIICVLMTLIITGSAFAIIFRKPVTEMFRNAK